MPHIYRMQKMMKISIGFQSTKLFQFICLVILVFSLTRCVDSRIYVSSLKESTFYSSISDTILVFKEREINGKIHDSIVYKLKWLDKRHALIWKATKDSTAIQKIKINRRYLSFDDGFKMRRYNWFRRKFPRFIPSDAPKF